MGKRGKRGAGEGSITKRKDGRWEAKMTIGYGEEGKQKRKYFYGQTREKVQKKLNKALRDLQQGILPTPERQTVKQFLNHWLETCARPKVRPRTYAGYKEHIDHRINPAIGGVRLHELSPQQVQKFVTELGKTLAPATVARIRATLRSALTQAERWSLVSRNVAKLVSVPKAKRPITRFLAPGEAQSLVNAASGFRLGGVFSVAVALGLRLGEVLGLTWDDVDLEMKTLRVRQTLQRLPRREGEKHGRVEFGEPKSEKSRRVLTLPDFAVEVLKRHRLRQKEERLKAGGDWRAQNLVFTSTIGTPVDERNLRREFKAGSRVSFEATSWSPRPHKAATGGQGTAFPARF